MNLRTAIDIQSYCNPETAATHGTKCGRPTREGTTLSKRTARQKGFTYSMIHHSSPKNGFALSIHKDNEFVIDGKPTANHISSYVKNHLDLLKSDPRMHVGGWFDPTSKRTYLDVSLIEKNKKQAMILAQKHKQLAIFDLGNKRVINTPKKTIKAERMLVGDKDGPPLNAENLKKSVAQLEAGGPGSGRHKEVCFACNRPIKGIPKKAVTSDGQMQYVGPDCHKKICKAHPKGYQPPLGGPKLFKHTEIEAGVEERGHYFFFKHHADPKEIADKLKDIDKWHNKNLSKNTK